MSFTLKVSILSNYLQGTEVYQEKARNSILHSLYIQALLAGTYTDGPLPNQQLTCSPHRLVKNKRV